ncbi:MAG: phytase [Rehaibacterium terrae]|uniref:phytase n=1 Tax=Rehaibacterium terrae TaxID=1341696 RepID=UPI003918C589
MPLTRRLSLLLLVLLLLLVACAGPGPRPPLLEADAHRERPSSIDRSFATVAEAFIAPGIPEDTLDSPAAWLAEDGRLWLLVTAKTTHRLRIYDGEHGENLRTFGRRGPNPGEFDRPNGIAVFADLLFVAERDNRRVQVLRLPELRPLATFGESELRSPYGLWLHELAPGELEVIVTDSYMEGADHDTVPPLDRLDGRLRRYRVLYEDDAVSARHVEDFGDTSTAGAIRVAESVFGDPHHDRLLVAEEHLPTGTALRVYELASGRFSGLTLGQGLFGAQAEGIALWACPDGSGYWLATDQYPDRSLFHVFDRESLTHLGTFAGETVANTDGIWLHAAGSRRFPAGVFFAVHNDEAVAAFDWRDIAAALGLRVHCED